MTDRRFGLQLRAGAHAELARLAEGLREEAQKRLPRDRGALAAVVRVTPCPYPQMAVMVGGQHVQLAPAHLCLDRIDLVVAATEDERPSRADVIPGCPANSPSPPPLITHWRRTETPLARVLVKAGTVQITQANIFPPDVEVPTRRPASDSSWLAVENAESMRHRYKAGGVVRPADVLWQEPATLRPGAQLKRARSSSVFPIAPLALNPPPRRQVIEVGAGLFTVAGWLLSTFDRVLAEAVAREFDRIDPLPPVESP